MSEITENVLEYRKNHPRCRYCMFSVRKEFNILYKAPCTLKGTMLNCALFCKQYLPHTKEIKF